MVRLYGHILDLGDKKNRTPSWPQVAAIAPLGHSRWPTVSQNITSESLKTFIMLYDVCRSCIVVLSSTHRYKEYGVISDTVSRSLQISRTLSYTTRLYYYIVQKVTLYCIVQSTCACSVGPAPLRLWANRPTEVAGQRPCG